MSSQPPPSPQPPPESAAPVPAPEPPTRSHQATRPPLAWIAAGALVGVLAIGVVAGWALGRAGTDSGRPQAAQAEVPTSATEELFEREFVRNRVNGQDAATKADARNAVSQMESCYVDDQSYANCMTAPAEAGLTGVVASRPPGADYVITAVSDSGNTFTVRKALDGEGSVTRTCAVEPGALPGGCTDGTW